MKTKTAPISESICCVLLLTAAVHLRNASNRARKTGHFGLLCIRQGRTIQSDVHKAVLGSSLWVSPLQQLFCSLMHTNPLGTFMNSSPMAQSEQRRKILIVDDDPNMVHILARTLLDVAQLHFSVRGEDALKKLDTHSPDVMLIDVDMPDLSGYDVMERMRRNPRCMATQVIMVTSHNDEAYRKRAMALGAVDFFVKPVSRNMVRERVEQLLNPSEVEAIELSLSPHGDFSFTTDHTTVTAPEVNRTSASYSPQALRSDAITSELFERMTSILEQTESIRSNSRKTMNPSDLHCIGRIEEECAEVVQLLVSLSDSEHELQ